MEDIQNPGRRQLLAAAFLPELERLLKPLMPKPDAFNEWFQAVRLDDVSRCKALLSRGFDPNTVEPERFDTGLILAVREKSSRVFSLLLDTPGIHLDARSRNGDTALMIAAYLSDAVSALALIEKEAEINRTGWTALHYAAASGSVAIVRSLLDHAAYIDAESPNQTTPLMMAARAGHKAVVLLLLEEGADASLKNALGLTAADFARSQGQLELVTLLEIPKRTEIAPATPED